MSSGFRLEGDSIDHLVLRPIGVDRTGVIIGRGYTTVGVTGQMGNLPRRPGVFQLVGHGSVIIWVASGKHTNKIPRGCVFLDHQWSSGIEIIGRTIDGIGIVRVGVVKLLIHIAQTVSVDIGVMSILDPIEVGVLHHIHDVHRNQVFHGGIEFILGDRIESVGSGVAFKVKGN